MNDVDWLTMFEFAPVGLHVVAADGTILRANRAELKALGYSYAANDYIGKSIVEFHASEMTINDMLDHLSHGRNLTAYRAALKTRLGNELQVIIYSSSRMDGDRLVNTRCFTRSADPEKGIEIIESLSLRENEGDFERHSVELGDGEISQLVDFFENAPVGIMALDAEQRITWLNRAQQSTVGWSFEEIVGRKCVDVVNGEIGRSAFSKALSSKGAMAAHPIEVLRKDGQSSGLSVWANCRIPASKRCHTLIVTYPAVDNGNSPTLDEFLPAWP